MDILKDYEGLTNIFNKNTDEVKRKILKTIIEAPSIADKVGWIYGFFAPNEANTKTNFWIKMGRTERNPFLRVDEWGGLLFFCIKTSFNRKCERLIHLFFDYARNERINICGNVKENILDTEIQVFNSSPVYEEVKLKGIYKFLNCVLPYCFSKPNPIVKYYIDTPTYIPPVRKIKCENESKSETTSTKETEWFHFNENINLVSFVGSICKLIEDTFISSILLDPERCVIRKNLLKVNINIATKEELVLLPYITKKQAESIIEYRKNKIFSNIEEIKLVNNNISKKFYKLRDNITV